MSLNAFFLYFGGKSTLSRYYPPPQHETIIEPFAGSAGYSTRHHHRRVILLDKDPVVVGIWSWLLRSPARDILALPDLAAGQRVDDLAVCEEVRWLIGRWINYGATAPAQTRTPWSIENVHSSWGRTVRARLASQVEKIRHWQVMAGDYFNAPDIEATWFIDPPYQVAGKGYTFGSGQIDFAALGAWCRSRRGQVMVCENDGADWLPFRPFRELARGVGKTSSTEAIWTND
jgi:site-specific DNA-adenine methylase